MALKLQKELESGAIGEYWRIASINVSRGGDGTWSASASMLLYANEGARTAGKQHMHQQTFSYDYDQQFVGCPLAQAYAGIKARHEFSGAIDC